MNSTNYNDRFMQTTREFNEFSNNKNKY